MYFVMGRIIRVYRHRKKPQSKRHENKEGAPVSPREVLLNSLHDKRLSQQPALRVVLGIHVAETAIYVVSSALLLSDISLPSSPNWTIFRHVHLVEEHST